MKLCKKKTNKCLSIRFVVEGVEDGKENSSAKVVSCALLH